MTFTRIKIKNKSNDYDGDRKIDFIFIQTFIEQSRDEDIKFHQTGLKICCLMTFEVTQNSTKKIP